MSQLSAEDRRVWLVIASIALIGTLFIPFSQIVPKKTSTIPSRITAPTATSP